MRLGLDNNVSMSIMFTPPCMMSCRKIWRFILSLFLQIKLSSSVIIFLIRLGESDLVMEKLFLK